MLTQDASRTRGTVRAKDNCNTRIWKTWLSLSQVTLPPYNKKFCGINFLCLRDFFFFLLITNIWRRNPEKVNPHACQIKLNKYLYLIFNTTVSSDMSLLSSSHNKVIKKNVHSLASIHLSTVFKLVWDSIKTKHTI